MTLPTTPDSQPSVSLEPPGCPIPGACSCPGGEAELAKRLSDAKSALSAAKADIAKFRSAAITAGNKVQLSLSDQLSNDFLSFIPEELWLGIKKRDSALVAAEARIAKLAEAVRDLLGSEMPAGASDGHTFIVMPPSPSARARARAALASATQADKPGETGGGNG